MTYCNFSYGSGSTGLCFDNDHNFKRVNRGKVDYCLYCPELWCCLLPKQHKRKVKKPPVIVEKSVQCSECLAYEELTFCGGVLEGERRNSHIYTKHWRQKNGKIEHHCLW